MNIEKSFPYLITLSLLVAGIVYKNAALGYASVISMGLILAKQVIDARLSSVTFKAEIPAETKQLLDDMKRQGLDMNARIATLEYGVRTRGF